MLPLMFARARELVPHRNEVRQRNPSECIVAGSAMDAGDDSALGRSDEGCAPADGAWIQFLAHSVRSNASGTPALCLARRSNLSYALFKSVTAPATPYNRVHDLNNAFRGVALADGSSAVDCIDHCE